MSGRRELAQPTSPSKPNLLKPSSFRCSSVPPTPPAAEAAVATMSPTANSGELTELKKAKKHKKKKHTYPNTEQAPPSGYGDAGKTKTKKRKQKGSDDEKREKKPKKAARDEAGEAEVEGAKGGDGKVRRAMKDGRFAAARRDPRFRPMRRKEAKVAVDPRFSRMMYDPSFAPSAAPVDKRGRCRRRGAGKNPMLHYYLNQEEEEEEQKEEKVIKEEDEEDEEEEEEEDESSSTDEEEEDSDVDEYSVSSDIAHYLLGRHEETQTIDKETHRLAVVNMDWDHIKAVDLYMVMTSCLPKGGRVLSVIIYPSEYGRKCMEIESTQGPAALVDASDDDNEYDSETDNNKLRTYELNRLKYYYAVVVCDSSATANHLYMNLDGTEFLKTANVFDLQFIPDSMEFKHPACDIATEAPPSYKEPNFETRALQHSRVKLTWDDDEPERKKVLRRKFTEDQLDELDAYLASDGSESEDDDLENYNDECLPDSGAKEKLTKEERLALLLQGDKSDDEKSDDKDMEVTFNTELEDLSKRILERKDEGQKTVWEKQQEKMREKRNARKRRSKDLSDDDDYSSQEGHDENDEFFVEEQSDEETMPGKKHKAKAKDKNKRKDKDKSNEEYNEEEATKAELELLVAADQDTANGVKGYNLKPKKGKKGKKGKDKLMEDKLPEVDVSKDERFSAMFKSHLFALDPTDPQYRRSAAFLRKQAGKQGAHADRTEKEPPVEKSSRGSTLPPDEVATKKEERQPDGASKEKMQILSAVRSLKRNLSAFQNSSSGGR